MRSLWCAVIAACVIAGGVRVHRHHARTASSQLHRAAASHAPTHARRQSSSPVASGGAFIVADGVRFAYGPDASSFDLTGCDRDVIAVAPCFVRSSRGPPRHVG